ncbi:MAG: DUF192 domain-containing protein [Chloroflexota bacterium]
MIVENLTKSTTLVDRGRVADTFFSRLKGLLGSPPLERGQGLLLKNEKSIHTLFMGFPIDVVYLNNQQEVIKIDANMVPYRLGAFVRKSASILELPVGIVQESQTTIGDTLKIIENPVS